MSPSDAQPPSDALPPLSRRQARERERAASAGAQPVTPPPTVAAPAAGSPDSGRRRPGSHVAPVGAAPSQASGRPESAPGAVPIAPVSQGVPDLPPASATEIVPGTGGLTRRQIRLMREAEGQAVRPVPLQNPTPQSSDRTVQDVLGTVASLHEHDEHEDEGDDATPPPTAPSGFAGSRTPAVPVPDATTPVHAPTPPEPEPAAAPSDWQEPAAEVTELDPAAVEQATSADGSPDAIEPLETAAAHAEEPRRHRSTWAPQSDDDTESELDVTVPDRAAATPGVFPLALDSDDRTLDSDDSDDDTNEVPVQTDDPGVAFRRPVEPKPLTSAFEPPVGHWSTQAHDSNDTEVHDEETGTRRVAETRSNAIILPNSALADPTGALNATGEVILTGSIDLPASLSSTGSHRPIDGAEVDRLLEQHDEQPETDASPVRASRAVSSHTSTRQVVLAAAKPKESRAPMILFITVGGICVAAAAVIVVALVSTNFFGS